MNLNPQIWGPHAWFFIESCIMAYPNNPNDNEKQKMKEFLNLLQYILPCEKCRYNYSNHLKQYPLTDIILSNKDKLLEWSINIHNLTNNNNLTIDSVLKYYNNKYNTNNNNNSLYLFIIIIFILLFILYNKYKK